MLDYHREHTSCRNRTDIKNAEGIFNDLHFMTDAFSLCLCTSNVRGVEGWKIEYLTSTKFNHSLL